MGTAEGTYEAYQYARKSPAELRAPEAPGDYEVRYLGKDRPFPTIARTALVVTPVSASLTVQPTVDAGAKVMIEWTGPDNHQDFMTIVEAGAADRKYGIYGYTRKGSPLELTAPDQAGAYEVRYLTGGKYSTLATAPLMVGATSASLDVSSAVAAGSPIEVVWTGPDNPKDWIAIVRPGSSSREYLIYGYTRSGSPLELRAPDLPGSYEVVYVTGQRSDVLARVTLDVTATVATIQAPEKVKGGKLFSYEWTGPDDARDFVAMVPAGHEERGSYVDYTYTFHGSPGSMTAPLEAGEYELRYETGQSARVLVTRPITVTPPDTQPGTLRVVAGGNGDALGLEDGDAVELILDASGSMLKRQGSRRRIDIAKQTLTDLVGGTIPPGTPFALRVFGHKEKDSCRTDLEISLQPLDPDTASRTIATIQAMNLAKTPIARSLDLVAKDLAGVSGERLVVLITDGEETCDGDPSASIEKLRQTGVDVRVNIVGFAVDDADLKRTFRYWASLGGGAYHDAANAESLGASLMLALRAQYEVVNDTGEVVADGLVGGEAIVLPAGKYAVRTRSNSTLDLEAVVEEGRETVLTLGRGGNESQ